MKQRLSKEQSNRLEAMDIEDFETYPKVSKHDLERFENNELTNEYVGKYLRKNKKTKSKAKRKKCKCK